MHKTVLFRIAAAGAALLLAACGCSKQPAPSEPGVSTTIAATANRSTAAETITTTTAPSSQATTGAATAATTTTRPAATPEIPTARSLLGLSYGELLQRMDNTYYVIQQRGHADVACALANFQQLPYYEFLDADNAFQDWSYGLSLIGTNTPGKADALKTGGTVTTIYVKEGGRLTDAAAVGMTLRELRAVWPSLPDMTILYDFTGIFNRSFYGQITTNVDGAPATLYVDLTTAAAKQALAANQIQLSQETMNTWMGKTVSLPDLPVTGALLKLNQQG